MSDHKTRILEAMGEQSLTARQISDLTGITYEGVHARLKTMVKDGDVLRDASAGRQPILFTATGRVAPETIIIEPTSDLLKGPVPPASDGWSPVRTAILIAAAKEGWPFSRMGRRLGISRNAAIGKANRLGLNANRPADAQRLYEARKGASSAHRMAARLSAPKAPPVQKGPANPVGQTNRIKVSAHGRNTIEAAPDQPIVLTRADAFVVNAEARPWTTRKATECNWPVGDPAHGQEQFYCCRPNNGDGYCSTHRAMSSAKAWGFLSDTAVGLAPRKKPRNPDRAAEFLRQTGAFA